MSNQEKETIYKILGREISEKRIPEDPSLYSFARTWFYSEFEKPYQINKQEEIKPITLPKIDFEIKNQMKEDVEILSESESVNNQNDEKNIKKKKNLEGLREELMEWCKIKKSSKLKKTYRDIIFKDRLLKLNLKKKN
jgi:hypothetical protein